MLKFLNLYYINILRDQDKIKMLKRKYDRIENDEKEVKFEKSCSESEEHEY